jgi:hypothetical protein
LYKASVMFVCDLALISNDVTEPLGTADSSPDRIELVERMCEDRDNAELRPSPRPVLDVQLHERDNAKVSNAWREHTH